MSFMSTSTVSSLRPLTTLAMSRQASALRVESPTLCGTFYIAPWLCRRFAGAAGQRPARVCDAPGLGQGGGLPASDERRGRSGCDVPGHTGRHAQLRAAHATCGSVLLVYLKRYYQSPKPWRCARSALPCSVWELLGFSLIHELL